MAKDYYALLEVDREATPEAIKRAYRKKAMKVHPDVAPGDDAAEKFKELTEAYEVLSDPNKRAIYDRGGDPNARGGHGGFGDGFPGGFSGGFDFTNLVDAMFSAGGRRGPRSRVRPGQDALVRTRVKFHEAVFGATKSIKVDTALVCPKCGGSGGEAGSIPVTCQTCSGQGEIIQIQRSLLGDIRTSQPCPACRGYGNKIPQPCGECAGEGRVRSARTISVRIPAGIAGGMRIHLENQGEVGPGGGPAGDLYVEVHVDEHETFTRDGDNLEMVITVPMTAAALGTTLSVDALEAEWDGSDEKDRHVEVEVEPGTQSGTRVAVKGRGVPRLRGAGRGDLGVTFLVATPTKLDEKQRELLRELSHVRGEDQLDADVHKAKDKGGLIGWLRDTFS